MKIAITGSTGYIGKHLLGVFSEKGWPCVALTRGMSQEDMTARLKASGSEAVVHLASLFIAEHKPSEVEPLINSNLLFGAQVLEAMNAAGVKRLINTGTSWQHFGPDGRDPVCLYAATKNAFEELIRYYVAAESFSVVTLKVFDSYGPADTRPKLIPKLLANFTAMSALDLSPGEQRIDLVHIDDITRAYQVALDRLIKAAPGTFEDFALRSGRALKLREIIEIIEAEMGRKFDVRWGTRPYRRREVMEPWSGGSVLPGWRPEIDFRAGIRALIDSGHKRES